MWVWERGSSYHCSGQYINFTLFEGLFRVRDKLFAKHGKDAGECFYEGETHIRMKFGVPRLEIFLFWVRKGGRSGKGGQTSRKSCSSPATSIPVGPPPTTTCGQGEERREPGERIYHVQQATFFFLTGTREGSCFYAVQKASLHLRMCKKG